MFWLFLFFKYGPHFIFTQGPPKLNFGTALQKTKVFNNEMAGSLCQPKFDQRQDKSNRLIKKKKITNTSSGCIEKKQYK